LQHDPRLIRQVISQILRHLVGQVRRRNSRPLELRAIRLSLDNFRHVDTMRTCSIPVYTTGNDTKAVEILRRCREGMPDHGRVLIVEIVLAPGRPIGHPHRLIDLEMMVTLGGKERSEQEFAALLTQAGLMSTTVTPVAGSFFSVVEAAAA
jgi:O-methyltransferase domain